MTPQPDQQIADAAKAVGEAILERLETLEGASDEQLAIATAGIAHALGTIAQRADDIFLIHATSRMALAVAAAGALAAPEPAGVA